MIRTNKIFQATLYVFIAVLLLVHSACKPPAETEIAKEPTGSEEASSEEPSSKEAASTKKDSAKKDSAKVDFTDSANDTINTKLKAEPVASTTTTIDQTDDATGQSVLINGELNVVDWQSLVGKKIIITGELVVVDTFDLARRGQVKLARERIYVPTSHVDPNDADPNLNTFEGGSNVAKVVKAQKFNDQATITLDDTSSKQNIFPPTLFPNLGKTHRSVRIGSKVQGVSGTLMKSRNKYTLATNEPLRWTPATRPQRPDVGKADVTVSSFNVLNYFTTIDDGSNKARGADSESEFKRQEAKIVSAIIALKADVIGLMEIENNLEAETRLVAALNRAIGSEVFEGCKLPDGFRATPGGQNAIRVGIIYRSDRVTPVGEVSMVDDVAFGAARTPIVQSFKSKTGGSALTVIVNHFKSKGGSGANDANKNKGDGQGAYNATRRFQSLAICNYIEKLQQSVEVPRVLVIGDLNAYEQEDPIDAMRAKGLVDLQQRYGKRANAGNEERHYSYIFRGQCGSLDHAMATRGLAEDVTGIATWNINADEPKFLDYNEEYNPKSLYEANPFRSSDHDPVLIGIRN